MDKNQVIEKVKKLLALSGNNPNEQEAQSALLKAQKMLAEYNISMAEVETVSPEKIVTKQGTHPNNNGYRISLGQVLAKNFRCEVFLMGNNIAFMGYPTDVEICTAVFDYTYKVIRSNGQRIERQYKKEGRSLHGVFNSYAKGFIRGIQSALDEQCVALAIVVPNAVTEALHNCCGNRTVRRGMRSGNSFNENYSTGYTDGYNHVKAGGLGAPKKQIENI